MESCEAVGKRINELAALPVAGLPAGARDHLAACPACTRALAAARLARGLLAAASGGPEPPAEFTDRVLAALPGPGPLPADADPWRLGWRLVPAFATAAALLLVLFQFEAGVGSTPLGLMQDEGLSASERLVLGGAPPDPDLVLAAVLERDGK